MKTTKIFSLTSMMLVIFSFSFICANAQVKKVKKVKKITRNWVWAQIPQTGTLSMDGMSDTAKKPWLFYKEPLALKKKIRGGSYPKYDPIGSTGYLVAEIGYIPPKGAVANVNGEYLHKTGKFVFGFNLKGKFDSKIKKDDLGNGGMDIKQASGTVTLMAGNRIFQPTVFIKFAKSPENSENLVKVMGMRDCERIGIGGRFSLNEIFFPFIDRGSLSVYYGKAFYSPGGMGNYYKKCFFTSTKVEVAKYFNLGNIEASFDGGLDTDKGIGSYFHYDGSINAIINLCHMSEDIYVQAGIGYTNNEASNGFVITLRIIGQGKNK